ncbi:uncharacterized protein LOC121810751 [Salvia splendens]|uniref:uncharacterized protein LOC121810751 n=1 Tax=Salvia splendens TaxID=180675 RepID=UPI001C25ACE7|nr:uncharacterized protein LOC121810751 [Salvia splendens]
MSSGFNGGFMSSGFNGGFMSSGYYYQSAASFCTLPINTGYSHTLVSTFFTSGLWFYILCLTVYCLFSSSGEFIVIIPSTGVMFSNSTHVNTVPLYLNSVPSNAPPSYVYAQPSVVNQVGPPELSPAARLLARTYENQALVFRDEQGQERVYCSICCEYGSGSSSRGYGYHSPDGSRNITVPAFEAHRGTKYHAKAVIAKEKGKARLVTLMEKVDTCMEKVVTSVEEIKAMLNEKQDGNIGRQKLGPWNINFQMVNFLQQFFQSVYQVDYLTLRHGFITAHFSEGNSFDFQKYIERALEKDFEVAVGMR